MINEQKSKSSLAPYRALDLTDEKGLLCGKILGDLGADVIKIENPGGDSCRNTGPFLDDDPDPEKSLFWFAFNANKRGITLNIETSAGQDIFRRLVRTADFVIESYPPGYMESYDLGYPVLSALNPGIILTSITPFGQTGPYSNYKAADIVAWAMGGMMYVCGDTDRPPVQCTFPQAYLQAGAQAAVGSLFALYHRSKNGEGQQVDISIQQSVLWTVMDVPPFWELTQINQQRAGAFRSRGSSGAIHRQIYPCKDGYVHFTIYGGQLGASYLGNLVTWMSSEDMASDFLKEINWLEFDTALAKQELYDRLEEEFSQFFMTHTKAELYEGAVKWRTLCYPVSTAKDAVNDPQLHAREFWRQIDHEELGVTITYPGPFAKLSETPCEIRRRAPLIGEHNEEIYIGELGIPNTELILLRQSGVI